MKKVRIFLVVGVVAILALIVVGRFTRQAKSDALQETYTGIVTVRGIVVHPTPFTRTIEETGSLAGNKESMIASEVGGRVKEVKVEVGAFVKEGDALIHLDDEIYKLDMERTKIAFDKAKLDYDRLDKLYKQKSISDSDIEAARLGVKSAELGYKMSLKNYNEATIRAPFSGTVAAKMTEVGQMVERGMPVVQLVDVGSLKLTVQIAEDMLRDVSTGASATIVIDALRDTLAGKVTAIGSRAATGSRTFPVEIRVPGNGKLRSGMFARALITGNVKADGLLLPRVAVLPDAGRTIVFVSNNRKAEKKIVRIISSSGDMVAVDGIADGDTVITVGNQQLSQGSPLALTIE